MKYLFPIILASSLGLILSTGCSNQNPAKIENPSQPSGSASQCTPEFAAEYETFFKLKEYYIRPEDHYLDTPLTTTAQMKASCERAMTNLNSYKGGRTCYIKHPEKTISVLMFNELRYCRELLAGKDYPVK